MSLKARHVVAKALGIKLQEQDPYKELDTPGASVLSGRTEHSFVEEPPLVLDYLNSLIPSGKDLYRYLLSLFPFLSWIGRYNLQWFIGDLVAGTHSAQSRKQGNGPARRVGLLTTRQVSPSALSSCPRAWLMPSWLTWTSNSACIRRSCAY
jgi:hypothetical protein